MSKPKRTPMTVADLIESLSQYPREMPVLVDGYESGFDHPAGVYALNVSYHGDQWWSGEFDDDPDEASFGAVVIPR